LTPDQAWIVEKIIESIGQGRLKPFLLFGVTGSGKTEVYMRVIAEIIRRGMRALIMVPEISMTPLLLDRFMKRFGSRVVTIHSGLPASQRRSYWYKIREGRYDVVIGPRSCVFLPVPGLGVIIVDEEHDESYKEDERHPRYHGRDAAVMRGQMEKCMVILGSATPSIESYYNAQSGKYELVRLTERIDTRPLPRVEIVDLRKESDRFLSKKFREKFQATIARGEQVIIFLNRRGYAPVLFCPLCGYMERCPFCRLPLVYHKSENRLSCHFCKFKKSIPDSCPTCGKAALVGLGIGTQKLEELIQELAGSEKVLRIDKDIIRHRTRGEEILHAFESNQAKIMVGTRLVTKGFDFHNVTLVGVVNGDNQFYFPDFRAAERTFQILTQVAGRAGRGTKAGEVIIQTYHPNQYAIVCAQHQDFESFYEKEIKLRRELLLPPFSRLILLRFTGRNKSMVKQEADRVAGHLRSQKNLVFYGPKESFRFQMRKTFRYFILIKTDKKFPLGKLRFLLGLKEKGTRLDIDVDPQDVI
ncbi:MAG: primosomal protein N', partial [candidate division WOR-3 bacterium]